IFFFSSRRRHTRSKRDWSSDVCSSDLDLITFTLYIFDQNPDIRRKWQERLEYIMIDEFQDIDGLQYRLMKVLCGHHRNLFVVGEIGRASCRESVLRVVGEWRVWGEKEC